MTNVRRLLNREQEAHLLSERGLPRARAEAIARRTSTRDLVDDMEGAGDEGLYWAAARYSAAEGPTFRGFAQVIVDRSILRLLRSELRHRKLSAAGHVVASWGAAQVSPRADDAIDPLVDTDEAALSKLRKYVDAKVVAGVIALGEDVERRKAEDPERAAAWGRLTAVVREELTAFDKNDRDLFASVYGEGRTVEELAEETGANAVTLRSRHRRLLQRLRAAAEARGGSWPDS
jgi:RNA polymerase sigma factor (sigma-70 family)